MRDMTVSRTIIAAAAALLLLNPHSVSAESLPLPERNPLREAPDQARGLPLPERNPLRSAGFMLPERNPARAKTETTQQDRKAKPEEQKPEDPKAKPDPNTWSEAEVAAERAICEQLLDGLEIVVEPEDPVRKGECGAPAPVKLIAIGKDPQVKISPPSTVTCKMAAAMVRWMERDVQPAARKYLSAPVTRINIIGDYSCRQALGRITTRLSEHGVANALDIRDFVVQGGQVADLTRDWGPNARDIAAQVAAEKAAEAARKAAAAAAAEAAKKIAQETKSSASKTAKGASGPAEQKMSLGVDMAQRSIGGTARAEAIGPKLSRADARRARRDIRRVSDASHLGGPVVSAGEGIVVAPPRSGKKAGKEPNPVSEQATPKRQFLREIHAKACGIFGTVLGPEANEAHRNHFHLDMAKRRRSSYCE
jgi:hypothetical protein